MRRRFPLNGVIVLSALFVALLLTVFRQSPEGLLTFGLGDREVRAAPGTPAASSAKAQHNLTALKVFNLALVRVRDQYVDTRRIDPKKMMYAALDSVQYNIPEVLVDAHPEQDEVVVVVNDKNQTFSTKDVDSPWRLSAALKDVFRFIQLNMNPGADLAQVEYAAVNGMLSTLDPHSVLLDPESAKEMDISTSGGFGGLGIVIGMRKGNLTVIRPMPDTPAARAGVEKGDQIVRINSEATDHLTLNGAVNRMRGHPGTKVTIHVRRKDVSEELVFEITRDRIKVPSVEGKLLSSNVGYLKIKQFSQSTAREMKQAMSDLRRQGASAWVLDLRWNPGGLLEQAIQVSDVFVDRGTIVTTVGGKERDPRRANRKGTDIDTPVAVLVNGQSASASEIVAGAIKHLDRGVVIGSTTFGKGSVQILYENKDGSKLKLTIAEYLTPGDISIQSQGVVPDIELARMYVPDELKGPGDIVRLMRTKHTFREADLDEHLVSKHAHEGQAPAETLKYLWMPPADEDAEELDEDGLLLEEVEPADTDEIVEDFEVSFARDFVAQARSSHRSRVLEDSKRFLSKRRAEERTRVERALAKLGIDWTTPAQKPAAAPALAATIELSTVDGKPLRGPVAAGDTVRITGIVTNSGSEPAFRVHAQAQSDDHLFDEAELVFGKVGPGETRSFSTWVKVPKAAFDRESTVSFRFSELSGTAVEVAPQFVRVVANNRPMFAYAHQLIDRGNGDGLAQIGEPLKLLVTIKNTGKGKADEVNAVLSNRSGGDIDGIVIDKGRFQFPQGIAPGQTKEVEFSFVANDKFDKDELVLELSVYDPVMSESVTDKLRFPVHADSAGPRAAKGVVRFVSDAELREGASIEAARIGHANKGAVLRATGTLGAFTRVQLDRGRSAFAPTAAVATATGRPSKRAFQELWQVTPPNVELELPSLATVSPTYQLSGTITDDTHVEDVYLFVSNREAKIDNKKVYYQSNRGGKRDASMAFDAEIPLWPGSNFVTVVARENDHVKAMRFVYLFRADGAQAKAVSASVTQDKP